MRIKANDIIYYTACKNLVKKSRNLNIYIAGETAAVFPKMIHERKP